MGMSTPPADTPGFVSTGTLPPPERIQALVEAAWTTYAPVSEGAVSPVYPALARVSADLFGLCLTGTAGASFAVGDADVPFTIMSVSKPFVLALVCEALGPEMVRARIGVNATGLAFNSATAVERSADGRTNPMVNSGAIATTSLVPGDSADARWACIHDGLSRFAGRDLAVNDETYASASETNFKNRSLVALLQSLGSIYCDPVEALDLYTRQCALDVSARDLATMGATLADGGVNPITKERVVSPEVCHYVLAVMATAGMYETSGDWLYEVGLPGKSGIGGGIVTVSPGKGALATFSPPLDAAGNSVRGQLATRFLSHQLGMDLFVSRPA
ncbi:MAG: glutaminase A [Thermomicrobiales bacterium]